VLVSFEIRDARESTAIQALAVYREEKRKGKRRERERERERERGRKGGKGEGKREKTVFRLALKSSRPPHLPMTRR